jgi:hypothetical protein
MDGDVLIGLRGSLVFGLKTAEAVIRRGVETCNLGMRHDGRVEVVDPNDVNAGPSRDVEHWTGTAASDKGFRAGLV